MEKVIKGGSLENTVDEIAKEIIKRDNAVSDESIAAVGALQEEVSSVKSAMNVLEDDIDLKEIDIAFEIGDATHYVSYANGDLSSNTSPNYGATDYIDLSKYTKIKYKRAKSTGSTTSVGMAFYNASKVFLTGNPNSTSQAEVGYESELYELNIPEGAVYARFSIMQNTQTYGNFSIQGTTEFVSTIEDKYSKFNNYTETGNGFDDISGYEKHNAVRIDGTDFSFGNAKIYCETNLIKGQDRITTLYGASLKQHGASFMVDGTKELDTQARYFKVAGDTVVIPSGTVLNIFVESSAPFRAFTSDLYLDFVLNDNTKQSVYIIPSSSATSVSRSITLNKDAKQIDVFCEIPTDESTFDHLKIWVGVYKNSAVSINTEKTVNAGGTDLYENSEIEKWNALDFGKYDGAIRYKVSDLKEYIDNIDPNIKMTYIAPEDFGATGLGNADDYQALQDCIDYAMETKVPVKAYGTYAISQPIVIDGNGISVEINRLLPSFNDYAIKYSGMRSKIVVKDLLNSTGGGGIMIKPITGDYIENNDFVIGRIKVESGDAIHMECLNNGVQSLIYNVFHVNELESKYGNCIYCENGFGENKWYGGKLATTTGWGIYLYRHSFGKFYGFSMEQDCYAGIYLRASGHNSFIGFRIIELMLRKTDSTDRGTVLKFLGTSAIGGNYFQTTDDFYGECIDISEGTKIRNMGEWTIVNNASQSIIETITGIQSVTQHTFPGGYILNSPRRSGMKYMTKLERIICVPDFKSKLDVSDDLDMAASPFDGQYSMIVVKNDADITLNPSYCSAGTNTFDLVNTGGNSFSVTDCNGVLLVSSSESGNYKFYCVAELDNVYKGVFSNVSGIPGWWNGENDLWFVEHNGTTIAEIHLQPKYMSATDTVTLSGEFVATGTWSTSDSSVATVSNGTVTAVGTGRATITITSENGHAERWAVEVA